MLVVPPLIDKDQKLIHHNLLLAHLFVVLTHAPAMQRLKIVPAKNRTIAAVMDSTFPPIKSFGGISTPYVTPKTISYIHALVVDSISLHHSDALHMRALANELMVLEVLDPMSPEAFREEFLAVLDKYFLQIAKRAGASGRPVQKSFRRSFDSAAPAEPAATAAASAPAKGKAGRGKG